MEESRTHAEYFCVVCSRIYKLESDTDTQKLLELYGRVKGNADKQHERKNQTARYMFSSMTNILHSHVCSVITHTLTLTFMGSV